MGSLYEIEGSGNRELIVKDGRHYTGLRTLLCRDTEAIRYTQSLYGQKWPNFAAKKVPAPTIRRIRATWHPSGYDEAAMLRAYYDNMTGPMGTWTRRKPGYAKIHVRAVGKRNVPITREPGGKKRLIVGPDGTFNEYKLVKGQAFYIDFLNAIVIQAAYWKSRFSLRAAMSIKGTINKYTMRYIGNAPPGTLYCGYVEVDSDYDPDNKYLAVNWYLLQNGLGWNNAWTQKGAWIVENSPVFTNAAAANAKKPTWALVENSSKRVLVYSKTHYMDKDPNNQWVMKKSVPEKRKPYIARPWRGYLTGLREWT